MALPRLSNITSENELVRRATISTSTTGTLNGYYYSLWMQANTGATMDVEAGSYSLSWSTSSVNVVGGIGWMPGSARVINYSGSFNSPGNGYLSVYGWTTSPLVEYYIVESYGSYNPATGLASLGTVTSDGGTYNIYHNVRYEPPSVWAELSPQETISTHGRPMDSYLARTMNKSLPRKVTRAADLPLSLSLREVEEDLPPQQAARLLVPLVVALQRIGDNAVALVGQAPLLVRHLILARP
ncbi:hypothetical protein C0992_011140 [Termitomyces sp. T32_za158]|nr:hypothetical protein C0992_011140 [Termitomyces sp. T32_za158]